MFGFLKGVHKGPITTVKDLESRRFDVRTKSERIIEELWVVVGFTMVWGSFAIGGICK